MNVIKGQSNHHLPTINYFCLSYLMKLKKTVLKRRDKEKKRRSIRAAAEARTFKLRKTSLILSQTFNNFTIVISMLVVHTGWLV